MRARALAVGLVLAVALAGCHADPEPHVAPPTSEHGSSAIPVDVATAYGGAGAASSSQEDAGAVALASSRSDAAEAPVAARDEGIPADFALHFERTACFGTCPQYRVDIDAKGKMSFSSRIYRAKMNGSGHPWVEGCLDKKIGDAAVRELVAAVKRDAFFGMKDEYTGGPTDAPWVNTKVTSEGRTKEVRHYTAAPLDPLTEKKLDDLESTIDRVTGAAELVKSGKGLSPCKFAM